MTNDNRSSRKERSFSIELKQKVNLRNLVLNDDSQESALIEGTIGELEHAEFVESTVLEILGRKGVLRIDVSESDVKGRGANAPAETKENEVN